MKIVKLVYISFSFLLLSSPLVNAESKYPAADFQPKVVYQDSEYKPSASSASSSRSKSAVDPKYPAANFEPEVVYQDKNYKPSKSSSSTSRPSSSSASSASSSGAADSESSSESEAGISSEMLGLIVLILVGMVFYFKRSQSGAQPSSRSKAASSSAAENGGATGVTAYLSKKVPKISSVDRYLESKDDYPASGVAKYMAKKVVSVKEAAAQKVTGVEKYLSNK